MCQRTLLPLGIPPRYRNAFQILPNHSEHADTSFSHPHHKVMHTPRDTFKHQVWMKSIPEKNLLWNRKSEIAAALCLSWVISSLYSLIIDTVLIRMTDPNVALCLCVSVDFYFFLLRKKKKDFLCKQVVCHLAGVFVFFRSWETSVKTRFCSPQSTRYSLNQTVL